MSPLFLILGSPKVNTVLSTMNCKTSSIFLLLSPSSSIFFMARLRRVPFSKAMLSEFWFFTIFSKTFSLSLIRFLYCPAFSLFSLVDKFSNSFNSRIFSICREAIWSLLLLSDFISFIFFSNIPISTFALILIRNIVVLFSRRLIFSESTFVFTIADA